MSYKQVKPFNQSIAGTVYGECEKDTRLGYSIDYKYPSAWQDWLHTDQHTDPIPTGVDVPVFFWYIDEGNGHVGVRLADGRFWSMGRVFDSIAAYESQKLPRYRGWSTHLDGVPVIEWVADPVPAPSGQRLYFDPIGQTATFYKVSGGTFAMKIQDASYNWSVLKNEGNRVLVNSASAGGDCWVYLKYTNTGSTIPGRYVK